MASVSAVVHWDVGGIHHVTHLISLLDEEGYVCQLGVGR